MTMKKTLLLLIAAIFVVSCDDDCDHGFSKDETISDILVGSWFCEELGEENTFKADGSFSGRWCTWTDQGEGQGRYFMNSDRNRLTLDQTANGNRQVVDWTLTNVTEYTFTLKSDIAILDYGKIVETYRMDKGDQRRVSFDNANILNYESKNPNIATVSDEDIITATDEKGYTYIKVTTDKGNVWVKVIVNNEETNLWADYSFLIGKEYSDLKQTMGRETVTVSVNNGDIICYVYDIRLHNILDTCLVYIDNSTHVITSVVLDAKDGVPNDVILNYMNARYYKLSETNGQYFYLSSSTYEQSRVILDYVQSTNRIMIVSADGFLDLWKDYTSLFGKNSNAIRKEMTKDGLTFLLTDYSYSLDGSDYYTFPIDDVTTMVGFVFNKDKEMCEYWIYLNTENDDGTSTVYSFLNRKYGDESEESDSKKGMFIFYNAGHSVRITFCLEGYVKYESLEMEGPTKQAALWPDYTTALGKTHDDIIKDYGSPFMDDDSGTWYLSVNDYVKYLIFKADSSTGEMINVSLILNEGVEDETVVDYLSSLFTVFEKGTEPDGSQYAWINASTRNEATVGIIYFPKDKHVLYQKI